MAQDDVSKIQQYWKAWETSNTWSENLTSRFGGAYLKYKPRFVAYRYELRISEHLLSSFTISSKTEVIKCCMNKPCRIYSDHESSVVSLMTGVWWRCQGEEWIDFEQTETTWCWCHGLRSVWVTEISLWICCWSAWSTTYGLPLQSDYSHNANWFLIQSIVSKEIAARGQKLGQKFKMGALDSTMVSAKLASNKEIQSLFQ